MKSPTVMTFTIATTLLALGLTLFGAGMVVTAIDSNSAGDMHVRDAIALCLGGVLSCVALFMFSRTLQGVRMLEITDKDRAQITEMRRELGVRRNLGRLLVSFGALFMLTGLLYPFFAGSSREINLVVSAGLVVVGLLLVFSAVRLTKTSK